MKCLTCLLGNQLLELLMRSPERVEIVGVCAERTTTLVPYAQGTSKVK